MRKVIEIYIRGVKLFFIVENEQECWAVLNTLSRSFGEQNPVSIRPLQDNERNALLHRNVYGD